MVTQKLNSWPPAVEFLSRRLDVPSQDGHLLLTESKMTIFLHAGVQRTGIGRRWVSSIIHVCRASDRSK